MKYASVCSGVGTCRMAWHALGWETAWFSEFAKFPSMVLAQRFPTVPNYGDMVNVLDHAQRRLAGEDVDQYIDLDIDLLAGGTPCQAFSNAGERLSLEDARGNLTLAFVRLVHTIDALRPGGLPWVVWENVPGILNVADNAFGCFLAGLAGEDAPILPPEGEHPRRWRTDRKSGRRVFSWPDAGLVVGPVRAVAWRVADAQYFRLPQRRRRVVVVSCPAAAARSAARVLFEPGGVPGDTPPRRKARKAPAGAPSVRPDGCGGVQAFGGNDTRGPIEVAAALNANRGCHNPGDFEAGTLLVETVGALTATTGDQGHRCGADEAAAGHVIAIPINEVGKRTGDQQYRGHAPGSGIGDVGDPAYTLMTDSRQGVAQPLAFPANLSSTQVAATLDLCPALEAKNPTAVVQPFAFDERTITSPDNRSRVDPEAAVPTLHSRGTLSVGFTCKDHGQDAGMEVSPTMRAMGHAGSHPNAGGQLAVVQLPAWRVRRLTPEEYEMLQGYWKGHTAILVNGRKAKDGPRYKACGNGWAMPVFAWIGRRIEHVRATA